MYSISYKHLRGQYVPIVRMLGPFARGRDGEVDSSRRQQVSMSRAMRSGGGQRAEELRELLRNLKGILL